MSHRHLTLEDYI
jgi:hypothetical protein